MKKGKSPKGLLSELADEAVTRRLLCDGHPRKVGAMITKLSEEKRKILRKLKSKDIKNDRRR
jgi:hypothetical protein